MAEVASLITPAIGSQSPNNILAVQAYKGLHLEPPARNLVEIDGNVEPVTKEEEIVTKKKTELTTTRQIETRVKRQVVLEDGKVVQDSGPIVETNTTEDTDKQESETTERRNLGNDSVDGPRAIDFISTDGKEVGQLAEQTKRIDAIQPIHAVVSRPDGLVREVQTKKVISREEVQDRLETEDVQHLGDFSDQAYVAAVNSGIENVKDILFSPDAQKQLQATGPRIIHQSSKAHKVIDTEDTDLKCLAQPDGTLITEKKKTTEHEELVDEDLPEADDNSTGSRERIDQTESNQRFFKQRDEQAIEYVADGKVIGKEMRYTAENEQMERDGPHENPDDWDSLSDRVRKARRNQKTLLQQHRDAAMLGDRKDGVPKRVLDFEKEEETRKGETMKWLENHFGSESRSSIDSRDDDVEPTKRSFFNVTIKSNPNQSGYRQSPSDKPIDGPRNKNYFQGVSEWTATTGPRDTSTPKHFASKTFKDELKGSIKANRLRHVDRASREDLRFNGEGKDHRDNVVKSPGNLNGPNRRGSSDSRKKEDLGYLSGSRNELRQRNQRSEEYDRYTRAPTKKPEILHRKDSGFVRDSREDVRYIRSREDSFIQDSGEDDRQHAEPKIIKTAVEREDSAYVSSSTNFTAPRSPKPNDIWNGKRSPSPPNEFVYDSDMVRPTVPQRKRALERKMKLAQSNSYLSEPVLDEPEPDYSPTPRTRSISPAIIPTPPPYPDERNGGPKKQYQKTRFSSEQPRSITRTPSPPQMASKKPVKKSSSIGNSIRKLVGKIRSASVDRKLKFKSKRSPSPTHHKNGLVTHRGNRTGDTDDVNNQLNGNTSTYQQYNVIDSHIGQTASRRDQTVERKASSDIEQNSILYGGSTGSRMQTNPKQRFYLGEDPYGGSIYGKENKYDGVQRPNRYQQMNGGRKGLSTTDAGYATNVGASAISNDPYGSSAQTLGRFSNSTHYLSSSAMQSNNQRATQTLPRKLNRPASPNRQHPSATKFNVSIVNTHPTGPAKPARTYKSLNRSKSFNVHGLNGTTANPNPIYMEKLSRNYQPSNLYKSNPHLYEEKPQLKSPSIVNLVSRSQRDLTKIDENEPTYSIATKHLPTDKRKRFLKGLMDQAPELYKTIHGDDEVIVKSQPYNRYGGGIIDRSRERESSLESRSPITINKDTASIIRRGSSSTDDYSETYRITSKSDDPNRPSVTNTVHNFTKKTVPVKNGRGTETVQSTERKTVTTSRYTGEPMSNLRYDQRRQLNGSSPVIVDVRNGYK